MGEGEEKEGGSSGNSSDVSSYEYKAVAVRKKRFSHTSSQSAKWDALQVGRCGQLTSVQGQFPMLFIQMELCQASLEMYFKKRGQQRFGRWPCYPR